MYIQYFYFTFFFYVEPILGCTGSSCGLSLIVESRGYSVCGLLIVRLLTVEHRSRACGLQERSSVAEAPGL